MLLSVPAEILYRTLLEMIETAADSKLPDHKAGFRWELATLPYYASLLSNPLYVRFIDYKKTVDSVGREPLWKLLGHYGIPKKTISIIQCSYQGMPCRVVHGGQFS